MVGGEPLLTIEALENVASRLSEDSLSLLELINGGAVDVSEGDVASSGTADVHPDLLMGYELTVGLKNAVEETLARAQKVGIEAFRDSLTDAEIETLNNVGLYPVDDYSSVDPYAIPWWSAAGLSALQPWAQENSGASTLHPISTFYMMSEPEQV